MASEHTYVRSWHVLRATRMTGIPSVGRMRIRDSERGAASVEHAGLAALIALLVIAAVSAIAAAGELSGGRDLGATIARRITCGPRLPDACRHHPLVPAYDWPVARLVRALAPAPVARQGPGGEPLVPVDFRRCRSVSCAIPGAGPRGLGLTASNRRATAFTEVRAGSDGTLTITYWLYRPSLGWEAVRRSADAGDVAAASGAPVLVSDVPALVPLETLPGRNHYEWPAGEEPPWRWAVTGAYPGWSS